MNSVNGRQPFSEIPKAKTLIGFGVGQELFYGMGALLNSQVTMYSTDLKKFNTVTNLWTAVSDFPAIGRGDAFTFCCNGLAYVEMGSDITTEFNEIWMYDPSNNSWTQKSNFPGQFRSNGFSFVLNGKFYLGGGFSVSTLTVYSDLWE